MERKVVNEFVLDNTITAKATKSVTRLIFIVLLMAANNTIIKPQVNKIIIWWLPLGKRGQTDTHSSLLV